MNLPLITIIIPFFNRINFTIRALESALNQTYPNTEILIINDGSTEPLEELLTLIRKDVRCTLINCQNGGPAQARNIGINTSKGDYIAFLDSDDFWEPKKLEVQLRIMQEKKWDFSFTSYFILNLTTLKTSIRKCKMNYTFPLAAFHCDIATPTVLIKKKLVENLRFNESIRAGEDILFWLDLSKNTILHKISIPLTTVTISNTTTFKNKDLKLQTFEFLNASGLRNHKGWQIIHKLYIFVRKSLGLI